MAAATLVEEDLEVMVIIRMKYMQDRLAWCEAELYRLREKNRNDPEYQQAELAYRSAYEEFEDAWQDYEDVFTSRGYVVYRKDETRSFGLNWVESN